MPLFYYSLIFSSVFLLSALLVLRFIRQPWIALGLFGSFIIADMYIAGGSSAAGAQMLMVALSALGLLWWKWTYRTFALTAIASSVFVYLSISAIAYRVTEVHRDRRLRYAMEYVHERVPTVKLSAGEKTLPKETKEGLDSLQEKIRVTLNQDHRHEMALRNLHRKSMETFVNNAGFGVKRIIAPPTEELVKPQQMSPPLPQPGTPDEINWSDSAIAKEPAKVGKTDLVEFHLGSVFDFVNPRGFGYLTEEKQLYAFQSHHFRQVPSVNQFQVRTLDLVSLVLNVEPRVYVTKDLPRMDKNQTVPTRSLDVFETTGLKKLEVGDDLFIRETPHGIRMLGAVRSIEQCVKCHGGERGDLLGAFSYSLTRAGDVAQK